MRYRFIRVRDRKVITNDAHGDNTQEFLADCFSFCSDDIQRRLAEWFRCQNSHFIRFDFGRDSVIVTNRVATRKERQIIQKSKRMMLRRQSMMAPKLTAPKIITALQAAHEGWVNEAALLFRPNKFNKTYETTAAHFYTEVTVRIPTLKTAKRSGEQYNGLQRRRMDMVALVQPNYRAYEPLVIGIEIKVNEHDLLNDDKMPDYLPYCHLFYLAAPVGLADVAANKLFDRVGPLADAGLLLIDKQGKVVTDIQHGRVRQPEDQHLKEIYAELLLHQFKKD